MKFFEKLKESVFKYLEMGEEIGEKMFNNRLKEKEVDEKDV